MGLISGDPELGHVYLPIESATDRYGGDRPEDNLFSDSIVALDIKTGERQWQYQLTITISGIGTFHLRRSSQICPTARKC